MVKQCRVKRKRSVQPSVSAEVVTKLDSKVVSATVTVKNSVQSSLPEE